MDRLRYNQKPIVALSLIQRLATFDQENFNVTSSVLLKIRYSIGA